MRYVRCAPCKSGAILAIAILAFAGLGLPGLAQDANPYLDSAQTYEEKGDLRAAEIQLRNAARQAPQDSRVHARLAQIYLKLGELASAEREARSARDLHGTLGIDSMTDLGTRQHSAQNLRELASWYRQIAERAGSPVIWEARLRMAEDLEREADRLAAQPGVSLGFGG